MNLQPDSHTHTAGDSAQNAAPVSAVAATYDALENFDPSFQALLAKFGRDVLCVALDGSRHSATWREADLARHLGEELESACCGEFASDSMSNGRYLCCFHSFPKKVGRALVTLKKSLEQRALLPLAQILMAEPETNRFRVYWPATAELV